VVRRLLERKLACYPTEAKLELAAWLWQEGVFEPREGDTVVLSMPEAIAGVGLWVRWALGTALAAALVSAGFVHVEPATLEQWVASARAFLPYP
jgi:hypothetical protein